jgi:hypothetical protein
LCFTENLRKGCWNKKEAENLRLFWFMHPWA